MSNLPHPKLSMQGAILETSRSVSLLQASKTFSGRFWIHSALCLGTPGRDLQEREL